MPDRLKEIRARLDAATPGPWRATHDVQRIAVVAENPDAPVQPFAIVTCAYHSDADLIAHAPADIALLLNEVEAWRNHCWCCDCQRMRGGEVIGCECQMCKRYRAGGS